MCIRDSAYVPSYGGLAAEVLECIYNCATGAIGYPNISVIPRCTDFSVAAGITTGQRLDTVYLDINDDFAAAFRDSSWRPLATDANAGWAISTRIIVKPRIDTGYFNSAPVATVMSPINIPYNKSISITIPVADADGDTLRCRWANKSNGINECRDVCPPNSLPPNTIIYPNCTIIINGQNLSDWYAVAVTVSLVGYCLFNLNLEAFFLIRLKISSIPRVPFHLVLCLFNFLFMYLVPHRVLLCLRLLVYLLPIHV